MSSSSAERPSLSKRSSARTRTVSGSEYESSCSRSANCAAVLITAATVESENVSSASVSPDRLKRKKRRKDDDNFSRSEDKLRRRVLESGKCKKLEHKMIEKAKLKVVVVQLIRLEDERRLQERREQRRQQQQKVQEQQEQRQEQQPVAAAVQPKFEEAKRLVEEPEKRSKKVEEEKVEERLRLPGLTLPAEIDPRILQQQLVIKINKHQTEKLLQSKRRQLQIDADVSECADKLIEKLTDVSSSDDSNKCTKNANISSFSNGKRVSRISVDKINNDRLPDRLLKDISKCTTDSVTPAETSVSESQPESSKSFVNSCRKQKRSSLDQRSSDKQSVDLLEGRPKCPKEAGERHPEGFVTDAKRYPKSSNKGTDKQLGIIASGDIKKNEDEKHQSELPCDKSKKVLKSTVTESHPRPRRNLASKNIEKHSNEPLENNQSDKPPAQNEKLSQKVDKNIQDSFKNQSDSHKKIARKAAEKHESHVVSAFDIKVDDDKKLIEEYSKKHLKRRDRKIECSKNETDNSKRVTKRADDKHEKSGGNIIESCVNYVADSINAPEKLPDKLVKDVKVCIKNQIENVITNKLIADVKSDKPHENVLKNESNDTRNVTQEISNNRSQNVHNNIQFSKNCNENNIMVRKDPQEIAHVVDESGRKHSKNSNKKVIKIDIDNKKQNKIKIIKNSNEKLVKNSIDNHFQDAPNIVEEQDKINFYIGKEMKKVPEINQRPKRRLAAKTSEVNTEIITENNTDYKEDSVDKANERLTKNLNTTVTECKNNIKICNRRIKRLCEKKEDHSKSLIENNSDHTQQPHENKEKIPEKLNLEENTKSQTESIKRVKRKSTSEMAQNSNEENQKVLPHDSCKIVTNFSKNQIEKKMNTRSSNLRQEQHTESSVENHSNTIKNIALDNSIKIYSKTSTRSSNQKQEQHIENSLENNLNTIKNIALDNSVKISSKTSTRSSNQKQEQRIENSVENNLNTIKTIALDNSVKISSKTSTRSSNQKQEQHIENSVENNSNTTEIENIALDNSVKISSKTSTRLPNHKQEQYTESSVENNSNTIKNIALDNSIKISSKTSIRLPNHKQEQHTESSVENHSNTIKNIALDNSIKISGKTSIRSSNHKQEQHIENSVENNSNTIEKIVLDNTVNVSSKTDKINCNISDGTNSFPARKRGRPRKVLPNPILKDTETVKRNNTDSTQQNLKEKQDHCSKISNNSKMVTRKSLINKHVKPIEKAVKHCLINSRKTIEKNKDQLQLPEETQEIVKVCSKSQTENQKRVTRKSSSDKHERQAENPSNKTYEYAQSAVNKTDDKISEKTQMKMKESLTIQTEGLKRVTRKSASDKHDKHAENLIVNNTEIMQNVTNDHNQILSEKLDNKENSKNQIEINSKITKGSPLKRDRQAKNLMKNNVDCIQTVIDENRDKSSENLINLKNFPNTRILRKNSIDKSNETYIEFPVENDIISVHSIVEENIDSHSKFEDVIEDNKGTRRNRISNHVQSTTENKLPVLQHFMDSIDGKQLVTIEENNLDSINVMEYIENEGQSLADENIKNCSNGLIDCRFPRLIAEEILSHAERLIASKEVVKDVVADVEKEPKMNSEICAEESTKEYVNDQSLTEKYQNEISIAQNYKESTDNDNKSGSIDHQDSIRCAKIILEELLEMNINPSEQYTEESYKSTENLPLEVNESIMHPNNEFTEVSCKNLDAQNGMNSFESIEGKTNTICSEDFDEVIKYFCIPANRKFKDNNESSEKDAINVENSNTMITKDKCQTLKENNGDISELAANDESHTNDSVINEYINISIESTQETLKVKETEDVFTEIIEPAHKTINVSSFLAKNHAEISPMHNHETTLLELRKKCTENLERRRSGSQENFGNSPMYPILSTEDSGDLESDKSSTSSSNSSDENDGSESEEGNYPDSFDSDENLADRLAHLRSLEIPPLHSSDDADSGVQTNCEDRKLQKRIEKIVLRCPRGSYMRRNTITATAKLEFDCKDCDESFISNRELKKHMTVQHRQRLLMKIRKTDENKHAVHIIEQPVPKRLSKEQEDDDEDEGNASASPEKLDEDELVRTHEDERITEGDIKIIVRKEGGSKNSHVIKEIKITPKSNSDGSCSTRISSSSPARSDFGSGCSSSRIPGSSPARSDLGSSIGGGNSCRMPGNSPPRFDIVPVTNPVKRGRGRPKKYPIFTEAELIAKHLGTPETLQVNNGATNASRKKKDDSPFIVEGIFGKRNENEPLFEAVESIVIQPDFLFDSPQNKNSIMNEDQAEKRVIAECPVVEEAPSVKQLTTDKKTEIVVPSTKRKRGRALSQESLISAKVEAASIVQEEKKRKVADYGVKTERKESGEEPKISQMPERSLSEPDLRAKYHITKELVVQLTKIDTVPKDNEDDSTNDEVVDDAEPTEAINKGKVESEVLADEMPRRKAKPKIIENELVDIGNSSGPDFRAVIKLNLRRKLESNNNDLVVNNIDKIDKCLIPTSSGSSKHIDKPAETTTAHVSDVIEESASMEIHAAPQVEIQSQQELQAQPELQPHVQPEPPQEQTHLQLIDMPTKTSTSKNSCGDCNCEFHIDDDFDTFEDNQTLVSESEQHLIVTPRSPTIGGTEVDDSQKAKLHMLMNAPTPCASVNNVVTTTIEQTSISQSLQPQSQVQVQLQVQSQAQIQLQAQPQLPPLVHQQAPYQPHQIRPQVQQSLQAQIQLPSQVPLPPFSQIQVPPQTQAPMSPQRQIQLPQPSQLLNLQQATEGIQAQLQLPPQAQLVQLNQSQQFCILFFPESDGSTSAKDRPPTATIVNFQPVPDNEIANKPLIFMPTTPTKISVDDHAKQYVCATCLQVLDIIGRLEASLGMTEEDKSVIKCPYCSNHFQSLFYLEYHMMQEHLKCQNEKQCRHAGFNSLRIPTHEAPSEFEIYITFALKCRSCYDIFNTVLLLNDHVMHKHKTLVRLKPPSLPFPNISTARPAFPPGSPFARKNGGPPHVAVLQCPSDCVCRIGIRSTDSPLQRQQMLKRCPNAMRRLEKIEPAAYEVYTCTLCKSTFLMKDEVVDHLMKMHEVSCKFPCYTCLTSFRSLQLQENHRCSETTLQDLDKLLSIAILPVNVGGSGKDDRSKYLEREDSSNDEYGTIRTAAATTSNATPSPTSSQPVLNGYKRKNGETVAALQSFLSANAAKKPKLAAERMTIIQKASYKRRRICPKCKQKFLSRRALQEHVIYDHVLKGDASEGPRKIAIDLLRILTADFADERNTHEINDLLKGFSDDDANTVKGLLAMEADEQNWDKINNGDSADSAHCSKCKTKISMPAVSGNHVQQNNHQQFDMEPAKLLLCEGCENGGPLTRRRTIVNNGHHGMNNTMTDAEGYRLTVVHPYNCKKCPESFPSLMELKFHKRSTHYVFCNICKKTFVSMRMFEKHKKNHRECNLVDSSKPITEDDNTSSSQNVSDCSKDNSEVNDSLNNKTNSSSRRDSSDSSSGTSKEPEEQPLNCSFCEEVCSSKVSLKNHLKREHGRRASICQFCNGLLIDTSEVRHMLDYHIVPSKSTSRSILAKSNGTILHCEASCMQDDVEELVRTLGKHRLQALMMYHDFEGKCNNAIMRCPMCPELFATRESCRFHYVWIHDDTCLLCDETFRSGSSAFQHKVDAHTSTASYLWCIQRLVTAIVYTLRLDSDQPSNVLYQMLAMRIENEEAAAFQADQVAVRGASGTAEKTGTEEAATDNERFGLEAVVLSEDQLPDSSNIIEVVIGKEDSEDDLLSMLNLSPNYESCSEQHRLPNAGTAPPEEEEDEETVAAATVAAVSSVPSTPILSSAVVSVATTPTVPTSVMTTSPVVDNYVTSGVCKYRLENDEEQLVLVVTDEDLVTFRDDIGSLAERISTTCDSLTLDEITEMLRAYFDTVNGVTSSGAGA